MITLNTIIYENNFRDVLNDESWFIKFTDRFVTKKLVTVNNLTSLTELNDLLLKYPEISVVYVEERLESVKEKFSLNINETTLGYVYTIPYFIAIDFIKTEYILNVATDCMTDINIDNEFLAAGISEIQNNPFCSTAMVAWTKNNYIMKDQKKVGETEQSETFKRLGNVCELSEAFNYTANFTDQFFLGSIDKLKKIDYNIPENYADRIYNGPNYGGYSFEKRMVGHQVLNKVYNCVYKGPQYYIHDGHYY